MEETSVIGNKTVDELNNERTLTMLLGDENFQMARASKEASDEVRQSEKCKYITFL